MTRKEQIAFIAKIAPAAQAGALNHGVPASVTIAQAILESGWGQHAPGNNFFGIKKGAANVPYVEARNGKADSEERSKYRAFASLAACFDEHGRLLSTDKRYSAAMSKSGDPAEFAKRLQLCKYSEDPLYAKELLDLIAQFDLKNLDVTNFKKAGPDEARTVGS